MNWLLPIGGIVAVTAFIVARIWVRRQIVNRWLDDRMSNRAALILFVLTHAAPTLLFFAFLVIAHPANTPTVLLPALLIFLPSFTLAWALGDYAVQHGVKEQLLRDRDARRARR